MRGPVQVALSRFKREGYQYEKVFNYEGRRNILLDFQSQFHTYTSSWRQSIETYWKLRDGYPDKIYTLYYEDFCNQFKSQTKSLCNFL